MEVVHDQGQSDSPHGEAGQGQPPGPAAHRAGRADGGRTGRADQPPEGVLLLPAVPDGGETDQRADGQERELGADAEQLSGVPQQDDQGGGRQGVEPQLPAAVVEGQAHNHDQQGRPHDRRPRVGQEGVEQREGRDQDQPRVAGNPAAAEAQGQHRHEDTDVQAGDGQQVDRAGFHKGLRPVVLQPFPLAQQHRRRQSRSIMRQIVPQSSAAGRPNPRHPGPHIPPAGPPQGDHAVGRAGSQEAQFSLRPAIDRKVELAGIVGRRGTGQPAVNFQAIAGSDAQQVAFDQQRGSPGRRLPPGPVTDRFDLDHHAAPLAGRDRPQGVFLRSGDELGDLRAAAADAHRPGHGCRVPPDLVLGKQVPRQVMPAAAQGPARDAQRHTRRQVLPAVVERPPEGQGGHGRQAPER